MELKVNDLFCGAGGMGLGFKQADFRLGGAWDFDKWAVESYGHNVSPKVKQADITQMNASDLPYADVWTFGFPCQDLSIAGNQAGMIKGITRSGLFFEVMRLLEECDNKPKVIMAENVKGLKKYLPVLEEEYNKAGYKMYYTLYNSKYWGVPQNRERYFVVGVREDIEKEFVFPEQQTDYVPKLSSVLEKEVDEKYYIDDLKALKIIEQAKKRVHLERIHSCITPDRSEKRQNGRRAKENEQEMFTLTSQDRHGLIVKQATKKGYDVAVEGDSINFAHPNSKTRRGRVGKQLAQTLMTSCEQVVIEPKILTVGNTNPSGRGMNGNVYHSEGLAPTCTTNKGEGVKTLLPDFRVRKLTPREYARLQGFPDTFEFVVSNTQLYKQFGNAVTVNVARAIAEQIKEFSGGMKHV